MDEKEENKHPAVQASLQQHKECYNTRRQDCYAKQNRSSLWPALALEAGFAEPFLVKGADRSASWVQGSGQLGGWLVFVHLIAKCLRLTSEEVWQPLCSRQMANPVMQDDND